MHPIIPREASFKHGVGANASEASVSSISIEDGVELSVTRENLRIFRHFQEVLGYLGIFLENLGIFRDFLENFGIFKDY